MATSSPLRLEGSFSSGAMLKPSQGARSNQTTTKWAGTNVRRLDTARSAKTTNFGRALQAITGKHRAKSASRVAFKHPEARVQLGPQKHPEAWPSALPRSGSLWASGYGTGVSKLLGFGLARHQTDTFWCHQEMNRNEKALCPRPRCKVVCKLETWTHTSLAGGRNSPNRRCYLFCVRFSSRQFSQ
jgi:hypothetical protein